MFSVSSNVYSFVVVGFLVLCMCENFYNGPEVGDIGVGRLEVLLLSPRKLTRNFRCAHTLLYMSTLSLSFGKGRHYVIILVI